MIIPISSFSWEFQSSYNVLSTIVLSFLILFLPSTAWKKWRWGFLLIALGFPYALMALEWAVSPPLDTQFYFPLAFLHSTISTLLLFFFLNAFHFKRRWWSVAFVFLSALLSLSTVLYSPALYFYDPFWGVLPGTVSLDAIYPMHPYYTRAVIGLAAIGIFLSVKPLRYFPSLFLLLFAVANAGVHLVRSNPFSESIALPPFKIYSNLEDEGLTALYADEFSFAWTEIQRNLLEDAKFSSRPEFKIYLYASDAAKSYWIGAHQTQIGNFIRGEMHLSSPPIVSDLLTHELSHLVHGFLKAPFTSYTDPFIFEGFAVALASPSLEDSIRWAAALKEKSPTPLQEWPRGFAKFTKLPAPASYGLAGGYSSLALQAKSWPWNTNSTLQSLENYKPTELELSRAERVYSRPSLFQDPRRRDCERLQWHFEQDLSPDRWLYWHRLCPQDQEKLHLAAFKTKEPRGLLKLLTLPEAQGDLAALESQWNEAQKFYEEAKTLEAQLKIKMNHRHLEDILAESSEPDLDVLKEFSRDPKALRKRLAMAEIWDRAALYEKLFALPNAKTEEERWKLIQAQFYEQKVAFRDVPPALLEKWLKQLNSISNLPPDGKRFVRHLRWEWQGRPIAGFHGK